MENYKKYTFRLFPKIVTYFKHKNEFINFQCKSINNLIKYIV